MVLVTDDFRIYHELAPFFEMQGLPLLGLPPDEPIPDAVHAIIGGDPTDPRHVPLHGEVVATWLAVMQVLDARIDGAYRRVVVGIDPGETIGLAVLADGAVLWFDDVHSPDAAVAAIRGWLPGLRAQTVVVHLGDGAADVGRSLWAGLRGLGLMVFTVSEHRSTPPSPRSKSRHTDAAIRIAMRSPWDDA